MRDLARLTIGQKTLQIFGKKRKEKKAHLTLCLQPKFKSQPQIDVASTSSQLLVGVMGRGRVVSEVYMLFIPSQRDDFKNQHILANGASRTNKGGALTKDTHLIFSNIIWRNRLLVE